MGIFFYSDKLLRWERKPISSQLAATTLSTCTRDSRASSSRRELPRQSRRSESSLRRRCSPRMSASILSSTDTSGSRVSETCHARSESELPERETRTKPPPTSSTASSSSSSATSSIREPPRSTEQSAPRSLVKRSDSWSRRACKHSQSHLGGESSLQAFQL